ncbi:TRAP transporter substrate-binding protein DctP [Photobacterium sp. DNB23_23_1]
MKKARMLGVKNTLRKYTVVASMVASTLAIMPAQAITLKISHVRPQGTVIDNDIKQLGVEIQKKTNGALKLRTYAANALGDYTLVQERISMGAVDMAVQPASSSTNRRLQIGSLPYLANDWEQAKSIYGADSVIREAMKDLFAKSDITILAVYPVYFGGISLNRKVADVGDLDVAKGIKLRVPPIKSYQLLADNAGYIGSPLPFSEAFTAVQTGVVDGVLGSGAEGYYTSFRDVTKSYIPLNTHFEVWYLMINSNRFMSLSDSQKEVLQAAAIDFESRRWNAAEADQAANEKRLADAGATIVEVSPEHINKTAAKIRANVWPEITKDIGVEWSQPILDKVLN